MIGERHEDMPDHVLAGFEIGYRIKTKKTGKWEGPKTYSLFIKGRGFDLAEKATHVTWHLPTGKERALAAKGFTTSGEISKSFKVWVEIGFKAKGPKIPGAKRQHFTDLKITVNPKKKEQSVYNPWYFYQPAE